MVFARLGLHWMITIKGKVVEPEFALLILCLQRQCICKHKINKAKDNLSKEERNEIKKVIEALKKSLGGE